MEWGVWGGIIQEVHSWNKGHPCGSLIYEPQMCPSFILERHTSSIKPCQNEGASSFICCWHIHRHAQRAHLCAVYYHYHQTGGHKTGARLHLLLDAIIIDWVSGVYRVVTSQQAQPASHSSFIPPLFGLNDLIVFFFTYLFLFSASLAFSYIHPEETHSS